jgi:hypothetical protein
VAAVLAFGAPFGHLDEPMFNHEFSLSVKAVVKISTWSRRMYGMLLAAVHMVPDSFARRMNTVFGGVGWMMQVNDIPSQLT